MKRIISFIFCLSLIVTLFPQVVSAVGLGISPSVFQIDNLVRGIHVEREIMLSRSDATEELTFKVVGDGQIGEWVSVQQGETFIIPSGVQRFPVNVLIDVPEDAPNGTHTGNLRFLAQTTDSGEQDGNQVSINVNAVLQLSLTVSGEQLLDYAVTGLDVPAIEEGWPMQVVLQIQNKGNVAAAPERIEVEIWDKFKKVKMSSFELIDLSASEPVGAFSEGDFIASFDDLDLGPDQYWAVVRAYRGTDVLSEESVVFEIFPVGTINQKAELKEVLISTESPEKGEIIKIDATIANIEAASLVGNMMVEVKLEGSLVEVLKGSSLTIRPNQSEVSSLFYTPEKEGAYTLEAHFEYSGRQTQTIIREFTAGSSGTFGSSSDLSSIIIRIAIILGAILVIGLVIYLIIKLAKSKKPTGIAPPPVAGGTAPPVAPPAAGNTVPYVKENAAPPVEENKTPPAEPTE